MTAIKDLLLMGLFVFYLFNSIQAQNLLKEGTPPGNPPTNSLVFESTDAKIGIGTTLPGAKLHIIPTTSTTSVLKIDGLDYSGSTSTAVGSLESWKYDGVVYYGLYQSQTGSIAPKNYFKNNVGIDVLDPSYKLDINGIIGCSGSAATGVRINNVTNQPFVFQYL